MARHPLWDVLPGFPDELDPDHPAHADYPIVRRLGSGGRWAGTEIGWTLTDPRLSLIEDADARQCQFAAIARYRDAVLRNLTEAKRRRPPHD